MFAGHTVETLWTALQLAYFADEAMDLPTQPFTFTLPGFQTTELGRGRGRASSGAGSA